MSTSRQRQAQAVVDARIYGRREAAARHGVSVRTLDRWIARASAAGVAADAVLAGEVATLTLKVGETWASAAGAAMRRGCEKFEQLVDALDTDKVSARDVRDLAEGLQKLGELVLAHRMLVAEEPPDDEPGRGGFH